MEQQTEGLGPRPSDPDLFPADALEEYADGGAEEYADGGADDDAGAGEYVSAGVDDDVGTDDDPGWADDEAGESAPEQAGRGEHELHAEQRPATGEPRVDAALARLDDLAGRPVAEHRAIFEEVHRRLRDVLGELDSRQPPATGPRDPASRPGR